MPIRFRCPTCDGLLSTARRKAGTRVVCPKCEDEIPVPEVDLADEADSEEANVEPVADEPTARPAAVKPAKVTKSAAAAPRSGPLFEREDFEKLLEPAVKQATIEEAAPAPAKPAPLPLPTTSADDGITISRGAAAILAV